jgi:predicted MPP superfamily phosphohydrolase
MKFTTKKVNIVFMGDFHIGHDSCDLDMIKAKIRKVSKMNNTYIFLMGDLIENAINGVGVDEQYLGVTQQLVLLKELLLPVKHKIIGCVLGNHEWRTNRKSQSNMILQLYEAILDVKCYEFAYKFKVFFSREGSTGGKEWIETHRNYNIIACHPDGRGSTLGWITRQFVNVSQVYGGEYDLMALAHFHRLLHYQRYYVDRDILKIKHEIITGHFLNYINTYAHRKMLSPQEKGCYIVTFYRDKHKIEVKEF